MAVNKAIFEGFAQFFENPSREGLRELLRANVGEIDNLDFKEVLPDKTKLAKHLLAFSNTGPSALVVGIKEEQDGSVTPVGIANVTDKSDIYKKVDPYLPGEINFEILDFHYRDSEYGALVGKSFQVFLIESDPKHLPYLCIKSGDNLKENVVYVRKGTNTTEASHDDLQRIISKRIDTGFSSTNLLELEEHIAQLKLLYSEIKPIQKRPRSGTDLEKMARMFSGIERFLYTDEENPHYPKQSFDEFVAQCIEKKKRKILGVIEVD